MKTFNVILLATIFSLSHALEDPHCCDKELDDFEQDGLKSPSIRNSLTSPTDNQCRDFEPVSQCVRDCKEEARKELLAKAIDVTQYYCAHDKDIDKARKCYDTARNAPLVDDDPCKDLLEEADKSARISEGTPESLSKFCEVSLPAYQCTEQSINKCSDGKAPVFFNYKLKVVESQHSISELTRNAGSAPIVFPEPCKKLEKDLLKKVEPTTSTHNPTTSATSTAPTTSAAESTTKEKTVATSTPQASTPGKISTATQHQTPVSNATESTKSGSQVTVAKTEPAAKPTSAGGNTVHDDATGSSDTDNGYEATARVEWATKLAPFALFFGFGH